MMKQRPRRNCNPFIYAPIPQNQIDLNRGELDKTWDTNNDEENIRAAADNKQQHHERTKTNTAGFP